MVSSPLQADILPETCIGISLQLAQLAVTEEQRTVTAATASKVGMRTVQHYVSRCAPLAAERLTTVF